MDVWKKYFACIYWAITTITTVGYGDILPYTKTERLICALFMICAGAVFSFTIGSVGDII
jgi:hypothetical protein